METNYLAHHGIKGQKWGVRRYQNEDGTWTKAGKERYGDDIPETSGQMGPKENKKKSKHILKLEEHYKQKGMNDEEAEKAARTRAIAEKVAVAAGVVTVAAIAHRVYSKHIDNTVDKYIKEGSTLSRIATNQSESIHEGFYAATNKSDASKYVGLYGSYMKRKHGDVYRKEMNTTGVMKIASRKSGASGMRELLKNDAVFKSELATRLELADKSKDKNDRIPGLFNRLLFKKANADFKAGKMSDHVYDAMNVLLMDRRDDMPQRFYSKLKQMGYDGVGDMNDRKYSGYNTKAPTIIFNTGKVALSKVTKINPKSIDIRAGYEYTKLAMPYAVAGLALGGGAATTITMSRRNKIVSDYRKEHPDTKKSYNEIIKDYQQSMKHYNDDTSSLYHYGIRGQRWGVRRFQNEDGTWTSSGKKRYNSDDKYYDRLTLGRRGSKKVKKYMKTGYTHDEARAKVKNEQHKRRTAVVMGTAVAGIAVATAARMGAKYVIKHPHLAATKISSFNENVYPKIKKMNSAIGKGVSATAKFTGRAAKKGINFAARKAPAVKARIRKSSDRVDNSILNYILRHT